MMRDRKRAPLRSQFVAEGGALSLAGSPAAVLTLMAPAGEVGDSFAHLNLTAECKAE
jgi:hypothetical protein